MTSAAPEPVPRVRRSAAALLAAIVLGVSMAACRQGPGAAPRESEPAGAGAATAPTAPPPTTTAAPPPPSGVTDGGGPTLSVADVSAAETDGALRFTVSLNMDAAQPVTVSYATADDTAAAGSDYRSARGILTFTAQSSQAQQVEVAIMDDRVAEGNEIFLLLLSDASGANLAMVSATATIVDNDGRALRAYPAALNVAEGGAAAYTLALGSQPTGTVSVAVTAGSAELTVQPDVLSFTADGWQAAQTVTVTAGDDQDAQADAPVPVTHGASGGGYGGVGTEVSVTIVENDVATLAVAAARAAEQDGGIGFEVTLSLAADQEVSVGWATGAVGDTADGGQDYASDAGTLRFPAGSTAARTIAVVVHDDDLDEPEELFTVMLSNPVNAELAGGGATVSATGTIEDDDEPPVLSIENSSLTEGAGDAVMRFAVRLQPVSARLVTVNYATADATATAHADYTPVSGTLTFGAGGTAGTIAVPILDNDTGEDTETFTVTLSNPGAAALGIATATGEIADDGDLPPLELASLQVTGGVSEMYPAFTPDVRHYALKCGSDPVRMTAAGMLLMFDNGTGCDGTRKGANRFTRIVEYDISSGTQAVFSREYRQPHGFTNTAGGVVELANGNWLIAWGNGPVADSGHAVSVSEIDPDTGTAHLELLLSKSGMAIRTYRAYRYDESDVNIPVDRIVGDITVLP